jgi:hypothetical protein
MASLSSIVHDCAVHVATAMHSERRATQEIPMHATAITPVVLTIVVATGCSSSPTGPTSIRSRAETVASAADLDAGSTTDSLPFRGRLDGTFTADDSAFPIVSVSLEAQGHATHMGRFTMTSEHDIDFLTLRSVPGTATATFVAANGDQLFTTISGEARPLDEPGVFFIVETHEISGGTGRFAGAGGTFVLERMSTPPAPIVGTTSGSLEGMISVRPGSH